MYLFEILITANWKHGKKWSSFAYSGHQLRWYHFKVLLTTWLRC